ncbi:MAG: carbon storage regulator CsrA [Phycisphaerales bacterium]|nr:carbon storage regulator CsrA [Phycisphaerales bacterium]
MLVLSRQRDETIMIGDEIEITVVDIRGDKVRLGITAPTKIAVHRKEVYDAIKAENQRASQIGAGELSLLAGPGPQRTRTRLPGLSSQAKFVTPPIATGPMAHLPPKTGGAQSA